MQYTTLGSTGLRVSRLGFGCMRLPMAGGQIIREQSTPMLRRAVELGVTYFDTAVGYCNHDSERALGDAMEGRRDQVVLSTKNPYYNKKDDKTWWQNLENSLERLRTSYIDVYHLHALNWNNFTNHIDGADGIIHWLRKAKDQGMVRHLAFSFHDSPDKLKMIGDTGYFESVTLQYNILDRTNEPIFAHLAEDLHMGITVMGPVGGGRLGGESEEMRKVIKGAKSVPEVALRFVLSNPHVSLALSGMNAMAQLEENVAVASRHTALTPTERRRTLEVLEQFKKLSDLYCTGCNYCMPCPAGVNIPGNFSALNYERVYGLKTHAHSNYERLGSNQGSYCLACGRCLAKCPQKIDIVSQLKETVRTLDQSYGTVVGQVTPMELKDFKRSLRGWRATWRGKLELHNISDQSAEIKASFSPSEGLTVRPLTAAAALDGFGRKALRFELKGQGAPGAGRLDTGVALAAAERTLLRGGAFSVAFAPPAKKTGAKVPKGALPVELGRKDQIVMGAPRLLAKHGAACRFAYDDAALYLDADVRDDGAFPPRPGQGANVTDRLTLFLDARPPVRFGRPSQDAGVFEIYFLIPGKFDVPLVRVARPWGTDASKIASRITRTADGCHVAATLPWSLLGVGKAARRHLGVDLAQFSYDRKGKPKMRLFWTGAGSSGRPDQFGHLFLIE